LLVIVGMFFLSVALSSIFPWLLLLLAFPGSFAVTLWGIAVQPVLERQGIATTYQMRVLPALVASSGIYFLCWYLLSRCFERRLWAVFALFGTLATVITLNVWSYMYELGWTR